MKLSINAEELYAIHNSLADRASHLVDLIAEQPPGSELHDGSVRELRVIEELDERLIAAKPPSW